MTKPRRMSALTLGSATTLVLTSVGVLRAGSVRMAELFAALWLISIVVLLTSIVSDVRRGRYWALSVIAFFVALGALVVWLVSQMGPWY